MHDLCIVIVTPPLTKGSSIESYIILKTIYKTTHFLGFLGFFCFLAGFKPSSLRDFISLMRSKNTLSTFALVFADVSTQATFHSFAFARAALHYTTATTTQLHSTTLNYTTLHYITLHYTTLHYTTLHSTTLHYTTLHYTTLH